MPFVNVYEAKTNLSRLIDKAAGGEDVIIARNGKPVARLTELEKGSGGVQFGVMKGKVSLSDDFDAPLPADTLAGFEGG